LEDDVMLSKLGFPDVGPHRRFVGALAIDALGSGIWMPLSMLYFLHQTSLGLVRLGLAMTIANTVVIPLVPYLGALVDRVGPKRVMQLGNAGAAVAFLLYPFAHSVAAVTVLVFVASLTRTAFWSALGPMVTQITEAGERELWFGFLQAMRNAGFGVGGLLAAVALTIGTDAAYQFVVLGNAVSYAVAFVLMLGVAGAGRILAAHTDRAGPWIAFGDRSYRVLVAVILCYALVGTTLSIAMPVYFVDGLGLPGWVPGTVYVINTVMIGIGQGLVVRRMTGVVRRRVLQAAVACTALSFVLLWAADLVSVEAGVVVVLVGAVVYTLGELTAGPVVSALSAEAAPDALRGRYMAATQLAWSVASAIGPLFWSVLLARGAWATWGASLVVCAVWSALVVLLAARMPLAAARVTNAPRPVAAADEAVPAVEPGP
jgi:MFS family permease